jgi:hypothetical protein
MTAGNLAPPPVQVDSTDGRGHRRQLATVLNTLTAKLYTPSPVNSNSAATDASKQITCAGNPVLIVGTINATAAAATFSLKRGAVVIATWGNIAAGQTLPFVWLDNPGAGIFTYSTDSSSHTNSASLSAVELK